MHLLTCHPMHQDRRSAGVAPHDAVAFFAPRVWPDQAAIAGECHHSFPEVAFWFAAKGPAAIGRAVTAPPIPVRPAESARPVDCEALATRHLARDFPALGPVALSSHQL